MTPSPSSTWLVTGAAGYLGSHVVEQLLARGVRVVGVDDLSTGPARHLDPFVGLDFRHEPIDIRDSAALDAVMRRERPAVVVHLAALHFIPACIADPPLAVSLNVHGTQSVLTAARRADVGTIWIASTGDVYAPSARPHCEEDPTVPFNIYGMTKLLCEQLLQLEATQRPAARCFVGRLFNLYGPRETNPHLLPEVLAQLKADLHRPLRLGNLWPRRDLVPVADAARAVIESALAAPAGFSVMNVATGVATSMSDVIDAIRRQLGGSVKVETDPAKVRPVERDHLQADVTRLRNLIGWTPHADLDRGIAELLKFEGMSSREKLASVDFVSVPDTRPT